jgi:hypothetical protein
MDMAQLQLIAGYVSSLIFVTSTIPMLTKLFRTHDLHSYSFTNIGLRNVGNLIHWIYVASLPIGPVWLIHGFFTLSAFLLLIGYLRYEKHYRLSFSTLKRINHQASHHRLAQHFT